jgi:carnitine O-acetyltransferase
MVDDNQTRLDDTGKVVLDEIYNRDQPIPYYAFINQLDYQLPQLAKPIFCQLLSLLQTVRGRKDLKLVDLGSSYGVNAALLEWDLELAPLIDHYLSEARQELDRAQLIRLDQTLLQSCDPRPVQIVGVDISQNALDYAFEAGFVDGKIIGNFEEQPLSPDQQSQIGDADLIMSTGCIGYVTEKTLAALLDAADANRPWMAHFVLRMFPFDDVEEMLRQREYVTLKSRHPVRQRRFVSDTEQQRVLTRLQSLGINPAGLEDDGWFYADFYFSRPKNEHRESEHSAPLPEEIASLFALK